LLTTFATTGRNRWSQQNPMMSFFENTTWLEKEREFYLNFSKKLGGFDFL